MDRTPKIYHVWRGECLNCSAFRSRSVRVPFALARAAAHGSSQIEPNRADRAEPNGATSRRVGPEAAVCGTPRVMSGSSDAAASRPAIHQGINQRRTEDARRRPPPPAVRPMYTGISAAGAGIREMRPVAAEHRTRREITHSHSDRPNKVTPAPGV